MKKITLMMVVLMVSFGYSQVSLPIDFEGGTPVTADFTDFDGGVATVEANSVSGGINTSATVAKLVRNGGEVWAGSKIALTSTLDFTTDNKIRMNVYTDAPIGTAVAFKIENFDGSLFVEVPGVTTVTGAWETLEWDFTGAPAATYDNLVFLFDLGNVGDGTATSTFYFDDIEQFSAGGGPTIDLPIDFEGGSPVTADFTDFDGGIGTVEANSVSGGINTSATVAKLVRNGGEVWAGSKIALSNTLDFSTDNKIRMKVYTDAPIGTAVAFKIENFDGSVFVEVPGVTTATGAWETLEWDFTGAAAATYNNLVFLFDLGNVGDGTATSTFYFDDIEQFNSGGGLDQIDLPIDFEGSTTDYTVTDFGGNTSTLVVDPEDSGNMVIQSIKGAAAETWAGTTISNDTGAFVFTDGLASLIPFSGSDTKMNLRVWSPDAGIPVRLKAEDATDNTHTVETETLTTSVGWQTLEFDFANEATGTATLAFGLGQGWVYSKISIFFNFGTDGATAGEKTYYFDEAMFGPTLGINDFEINNFKIYPNPTQNNWTLKATQQITQIQVFDILGKNVLTMTPNKNEVMIDASSLKTGLYFAKVQTPNGINSVKLIKK